MMAGNEGMDSMQSKSNKEVQSSASKNQNRFRVTSYCSMNVNFGNGLVDTAASPIRRRDGKL